MHALVRGVGALDDRAERDHVHAGELLAEDTALEAGVDRLELRLAPLDPPVDLAEPASSGDSGSGFQAG